MMRRALQLGLVVLAIAVIAWWLQRPATDVAEPEDPTLAELVRVLAGDSEGWMRADKIRRFDFPRDHGPHPDFKTEWWYFTGNLEADNGRRFGYQLTFFRIGLKPGKVEDASAWRTHQIYMAHFALTDVQGRRFHYFERFARAAQGLAGARAEPFAVWLEGWRVSGGDDGFLPLQLHAEQDDVAVALTLDSSKPLVLQGEQGLSRKSAAPGNASYYYSLTRMPSRGEIRIGEKTYQVAGNSWLDREWSTSALGADQVGWDWFALQLSSGRELMYYRLRNKNGGADPHSAGALIDPQGHVTRLDNDDVRMEVLGHWISPDTGIRYPLHWRLTLPDYDIDLEIRPRLSQQELNVSVRYWEGAVAVVGQADGKEIGGSGYLELTGYE